MGGVADDDVAAGVEVGADVRRAAGERCDEDELLISWNEPISRLFVLTLTVPPFTISSARLLPPAVDRPSTRKLPQREGAAVDDDRGEAVS